MVSRTLPDGYVVSDPGPEDVDDLVRLLRRHEQEARGWPGAQSDSVAAEVAGRGASTHLHAMVRDPDGAARAWVSVHDRARGRVLVGVTVDPELADTVADPLAAWAFDQVQALGEQVLVDRGLSSTQLDSGAFADDHRQQRWLRENGFAHVRDWWQMSRPVDVADAQPPTLRPGVQVRRVRQDGGVGMPLEDDLRAVHLVLEESFADHFNSYRETFEEFVSRLREDPGHRWDHWWVATVDGEPAGALVSTISPGRVGADGTAARDATYIDYIGVHRRARGRGVAKGLLRTVVADAAARGRGSVGLEVDADSPTGADGLYRSLGWQTRYTTQSWHKDLTAEASLPGGHQPAG